jgi:serine phosphatase RsbU (regulator of sigma subunit)
MAEPEHIVIIDDNENDLRVTRSFLERRGYRIDHALSGEAGLELIARVRPDAVVVDYRMPGMNGFEVTQRLKHDPLLGTIPVLMLTGADSAEAIVQGLGAGADDFVTKGADREVLLARLRALLRVKAYQDALRKLNQQMSRDLQIARRVQEALVPHGAYHSPRISIQSAYIPSETLSGDFYDYFEQDGLLYLFVADVAGHGLPAAILVSLLKSYLHTEADPSRSLADFMSGLNDFLFTVSIPSQYATAQLFRLDGQHNLHYSSAAHPPFLLFQHEHGRTGTFENPGNLLGAMPDLPYEEHVLRVSPGDTLFVYTDGLTDRKNADDEFYSIDRVAAIMESSNDADLDTLYRAIYDDINAFPATDEYRDDIAFVLSRFS